MPTGQEIRTGIKKQKNINKIKMTAKIKVDSLKSSIKLQAFGEIQQNVVKEGRKKKRERGRKERKRKTGMQKQLISETT